MGRKKKFIDKKTAHHFYVLHRSQQDPLYHKEGGSKLILHPADEGTAKALDTMGVDNTTTYIAEEDLPTAAKARRVKGNEIREVDEFGFPIDGYDYSKHLSEIGGGTFITPSGKTGSGRLPPGKGQKTGFMMNSIDESKPASEKPDAPFNLPKDILASEMEHDRMLNAVTLREDLLDPDMKLALEESDVEADDLEEEDAGAQVDGADAKGHGNGNLVEALDEDFMNQLFDAEANAVDVNDGFDYDAHVARLMAEAEEDDEEDEILTDDEEDEDTQMMPCAANTHLQRDIDDHFERVLEEYGDEEIGELDEGCYDARVDGILDTDAELVADVLAQHLDAMQLADEEGKSILLTNTDDVIATTKARMLKQVEEEGPVLEEEEGDMVQDIRGMGNPNYHPVVPEEDTQSMLDMWGGYKAKAKEKWDCETIVSTYSVIDNHPTMLEARRKTKKKHKKQNQDDIPEEDDPENEDGEFSDDDDVSVAVEDTSIKRNKKETAEEKRLRKQQVKEMKRNRRSEKKATKELFKVEKAKMVKAATVNKGQLGRGITTFKL